MSKKNKKISKPEQTIEHIRMLNTIRKRNQREREKQRKIEQLQQLSETSQQNHNTPTIEQQLSTNLMSPSSNISNFNLLHLTNSTPDGHNNNNNIENNNQQNLSTNKKSKTKRKCILTNALSKFNRNDEVIDDINAEHVNDDNIISNADHVSKRKTYKKKDKEPMSAIIRSKNYRDRQRQKRNSNQQTSETALQNDIVTDDINAEKHINDDPFDVFMAFDHIEPTINNNSTTNQQQNISNDQTEPPLRIRRIQDRSNRIQNRTGRVQIRGPRHTFLTVDQSWDFDYPCEACGKIYLLSVKVNDRHLCCSKAEYTDAGVFPQLKPLPPQLKKYSTTLPLHFSPKSTFYNNILSIGQISVDNGRGNRWERIDGRPSAVKLNGRVEHVLWKNTPQSQHGLSYFTYCDADQRLFQHTFEINEKSNDNPLEYNILLDLYNEQRELNKYAKEVFYSL